MGLPKTATTFLQKNIFPQLNINYFDNFLIKNNNFISTNNNFLSLKIRENEINLISDETLYGSIFRNNKYSYNFDIANKIYKIYPEAKIIVVFREKNNWIKSLYNQFMKVPSRNIEINNLKQFTQLISKETLDFNGYEIFLRELFNDVLVLHFEDFKKNKEKFIQNILDFIKIDKKIIYKQRALNPSISNKHIKFIRVIAKSPLPVEINNNIGKAFNYIFKKIN